MPAMNDPQRQLLSAIYALEHGQSPAQATVGLRRRFGWLTQEEAGQIVRQALGSMAAPALMEGSPAGETIVRAIGQAVPVSSLYTIDARVQIVTGATDVSGQPVSDYRTLRIQVTSDTTMQEVQSQLETMGERMGSEYGRGGHVTGVSILSVF